METALIIIISILISFVAAIIGIFIWARRHITIEKVAKAQKTVLYENVQAGMEIKVIDDNEAEYDMLNTLLLPTHNAVIIYHYVYREGIIDILKQHPLIAEYNDLESWSNDELMEFLPSIYTKKANVIENKVGNVIVYSLDVPDYNIKVLEEGESFYDVF